MTLSIDLLFCCHNVHVLRKVVDVSHQAQVSVILGSDVEASLSLGSHFLVDAR